MIKVRTQGIEKVKAFLRTVPKGVRQSALKAAATYIIGNERHGLKHYPPRRTHGPENPYQWTSEKQRRAYFASNGFGGGIPSVRKYENGLSGKWGVNETGWYIYNTSPYAQYVQGDNIQQGHRADGWRKVDEVIATNLRGAIREGQRAVDAWIKARK